MARVLIVDDEPSVRESLARLVEAEGLEVIEAEDGVAALKIVKGQPPDVILLDDLMPNLDGISFLKALRADAALSQPPVIMVAAQDRPDDRRAAIELGVVDYIPKTLGKRRDRTTPQVGAERGLDGPRGAMGTLRGRKRRS